MSGMSEEMRRKDREVKDWADIMGIVSRCSVCRLGLVDGGKAYVVPLSFGYETDGETLRLYFHCATEGRKLRLMSDGCEVAFEMDNELGIKSDKEKQYCTTEYESVMGVGRIEMLEDAEKVHALQCLNNRYHPEGFEVNMRSVPRTKAMCLTVTEITAKSNVRKHAAV